MRQFLDLKMAQGLAYCAAGLAAVAKVEDDAKRAVRLLGMAEALPRVQLARPYPELPIEELTYNRTVDGVRGLLDDATLQAVWAQSQAMVATSIPRRRLSGQR